MDALVKVIAVPWSDGSASTVLSAGASLPARLCSKLLLLAAENSKWGVL